MSISKPSVWEQLRHHKNSNQISMISWILLNRISPPEGGPKSSRPRRLWLRLNKRLPFRRKSDTSRTKISSRKQHLFRRVETPTERLKREEPVHTKAVTNTKAHNNLETYRAPFHYVLAPLTLLRRSINRSYSTLISINRILCVMIFSSALLTARSTSAKPPSTKSTRESKSMTESDHLYLRDNRILISRFHRPVYPL